MKSLKATLQEYLQIRRSLGYKLKETETLLHDFENFFRREKAQYITTALALEWTTKPQSASSAHCAKRLSTIRLFAAYRRMYDQRTEIPPKYLLPYKPKRAIPHVYSDKEIDSLLSAFLEVPSTELRNHTMYTIFGLLAVTGCRAGEILSLKGDDVDLKGRYLVVRNGKFEKSRIVPLHPTAVYALRRYIKVRDSSFPNTTLGTFFVTSTGNRVDYADFKRLFIKLSKEIGLRKAEENHGPRIHDLRHTFAIKTIIAWYREGENVEAKMPLLSTYLGHVKPSDTYWYLTGVPELLSLATSRLENIRR